MPRADITSEYRSDAGQSKFPRLKLQMNEKARIVVAGSPVIQYVHRLEAPNIVNMAPTYKKIRDKDGGEQFVVDKRFVSGPICHGKFEILRERGVDDKNCPACSAARERPDIFRSPQPKYAVNVLRYSLRPGGGWNDIAIPFGVSALVWVFGSKVMDKLIDIRSMGAAYEDIRTVDLCLEVNEPPVEFQKPFSNGGFNAATPAVWLSTEETRNYAAQYLAANGASDDDLESAIGKQVKADWMADDINRVIQRWDVVRAYESRGGQSVTAGQPGFGGESLQQGMGQLQQQYAQQPGFAPQGNAPAQPPSGYSSQQQPGWAGGGVDMGLLGGGGFQQAQQEAQAAAANLSQAAGVPPPDPWTGQQAPGVPPTVTAPAPSSAPATSAPPATAGNPPFLAPPDLTAGLPSATPPAPAPPAAPTGSAPTAPMTAPPNGLAGLAASLQNPPSTQAPAPAATTGDSATPVPAEAGKTWSFEDLNKLANGQ